MEDLLLQKFFEPARWEYAINIGVDKSIDKSKLRKLCTPEIRYQMYMAIKNDQYEIAPPHQAEIPKDDGTMRIVYVNEGIDRIFLSIYNDMIFELMRDRIHPRCKSYQKGIGCGKIVQEVSDRIVHATGCPIGFKSDLSKYFDSVPLKYIDNIFNEIDERFGKSAVTNVVRKYYHSDYCFDVDGNLIQHYQSLKQGCAFASFLADVIIYHIDDALNNLGGYYVRYSDDMLYIGDNYEQAMNILANELAAMQMKLNPKKVEYLRSDKWFKFLGFSIKGEMISLSKSRIKTFQKEIADRTIKNRNITYKRALNKVNAYLYKGNGKHSWASQVMPIINSEDDIERLNSYVMDCLRAVQTGKKHLYGLGYDPSRKYGVIPFNTGRNVGENRKKVVELEGYLSLNAYKLAPRDVRETLVMSL